MQWTPQFLENHLIFFNEIFYERSWYSSDGQYIKNDIFSLPAGAHFVVFFVPFWCSFLYFLFYHQIFYKCSSYYCDSHYTKKNVHIISPSTGGYFGTYVWLMFLYFLRFINIFSWNFLEMFLALLWWLLYKNKVQIVFPTAGCHFGPILACAPSFFEDQSSFSHKILYKCSWFFYLLGSNFWVFLSPLWY